MYLWRRLATRQWWMRHKDFFAAQFGEKLAVIERRDRKRLQIEVTCDSPRALKKFGGRAKRLPRDWLKQTLRKQKTTPLRIGNRALIIPAGVAFGTGEHATTAMSLQLLKRVIFCWGAHAPRVLFSAPSPKSPFKVRDGGGAIAGTRGRVRSPDLIVDLGTGSGILALAARCLGAKRTIGIDVDPTAISTAKANARRNKIDQVQFRVADVRRWKFPRKIDIVTANLFSELLIEILPKLKRVRRLILSGILREQEHDLVRALRRYKIDIVKVQRRGKWIAIAARVD